MRTLTILFVLFVLAMYASVAEAAGGGSISDNTGLSSSINEPGFNFHYSTSSDNGRAKFYAGMTNSDRLSYVSISISRDTGDPDHGWVNAYFSGIVGDSPVEMAYKGQSTNIIRHGAEYDFNVNMYSYPEILSWAPDGKSIYGDWLSNGSASATLSDVTPTYANMNYTEYDDKDSGITYFNGSIQWQLDFNSPDTPLTGTGFGTSVSAPTPEPATICLLGLGVTSLVARRHRR